MSGVRVRTMRERLRRLGPHLAAALLLPGGLVLVLLYWLLHRRRKGTP